MSQSSNLSKKGENSKSNDKCELGQADKSSMKCELSKNLEENESESHSSKSFSGSDDLSHNKVKKSKNNSDITCNNTWNELSEDQTNKKNDDTTEKISQSTDVIKHKTSQDWQDVHVLPERQVRKVRSSKK